MQRYLCIHGHFYQPPRENPWLEAVEIQDSAHPYHDWNERITAECYATNSASRILDRKGLILDIVSNYAKISFDMGPTLLSWLERNTPETYRSILDADRLSIQWRSGHGAAMAQAYNHMIMPLASPRDKRTQVLWGIADFRYRFGRMPEGMWLPETAVDIGTLEIMAELGIRFTVLAPHQAKAVRRIGEKKWAGVEGGKIDPKMAYLMNLPSGRSINIFFYDSPVSHAVAFEGILDSGETFAHRLLKGFSDEKGRPQLMHISTDGESYGHHHRFGDMALAYALNYIEHKGLARITNYGEYLELHPPGHEVEILENSSWSCAHGVERWRSDCGCSTGAHPGWTQKWRGPLREALDWLKAELDRGYEKKAADFFDDPWAARDGYIDVILDRSEENLDGFLENYANRKISPSEKPRVLGLLELQRHAMLIYTSCGWFFDDISGIEAVQILQYAGRAIQLAKNLFGKPLERNFVGRLAAAHSNVPAHASGARIYEKFIVPSRVNLKKVAAHFAISSLFSEYPEQPEVYAYGIDIMDYRKIGSKPVLVIGKCRITFRITGDAETICFSVLYLGNHDFNCGVKRSGGERSYEKMVDEIVSAFEGGAFADVVRLIDKHFTMYRFTLKDLFRDEQRRILETLLSETTESFEASYRMMYEDNRILMGFLMDTGIPIPKAFLTAAEFILNLDLARELAGDADLEKITYMLEEEEKWDVTLNTVDLEFSLRRNLEQKMSEFKESPEDTEMLDTVGRLLDATIVLPFSVNLWATQNTYYTIAKTIYRDMQAKGDGPEASEWVAIFRTVGEKLHFNLDSVLSEEPITA